APVSPSQDEWRAQLPAAPAGASRARRSERGARGARARSARRVSSAAPRGRICEELHARGRRCEGTLRGRREVIRASCLAAGLRRLLVLLLSPVERRGSTRSFARRAAQGSKLSAPVGGMRGCFVPFLPTAW
ncbi:unnamed protein product, partial [Prorocentrum cordatum]